MDRPSYFSASAAAGWGCAEIHCNVLFRPFNRYLKVYFPYANHPHWTWQRLFWYYKGVVLSERQHPCSLSERLLCDWAHGMVRYADEIQVREEVETVEVLSGEAANHNSPVASLKTPLSLLSSRTKRTVWKIGQLKPLLSFSSLTDIFRHVPCTELEGSVGGECCHGANIVPVGFCGGGDTGTSWTYCFDLQSNFWLWSTRFCKYSHMQCMQLMRSPSLNKNHFFQSFQKRDRF